MITENFINYEPKQFNYKNTYIRISAFSDKKEPSKPYSIRSVWCFRFCLTPSEKTLRWVNVEKSIFERLNNGEINTVKSGYLPDRIEGKKAKAIYSALHAERSKPFKVTDYHNAVQRDEDCLDAPFVRGSNQDFTLTLQGDLPATIKDIII